MSNKNFTLIAVFFLLFSVSDTAAAQFVEIQKNNAEWMESIANEIADLDLREIILPGTHDSGSRVCTSCWIPYLAETQNDTILEQLNNGIRYLDFRVAYNSADNAWIFSHGGHDMEDQVYPALDDIKAFLDSHPKEIIIIDFQNFPESSDDDDQDNLANLRTRLMDTLGSYMLPESSGVHTKMRTLWNTNKRIIVLMEDEVYDTFHLLDHQPSLWRRSVSINSPWPNEQDEEDAIRFLDAQIFQMNIGYLTGNPNYTDKFYVVQGISTASKDLVSSLLEGAKDTNPVILSILEGNNVPLVVYNDDWRNSPLNIIIMDYVDTIDFTPVVKSMNMDSIKNGAGNPDDGVYLFSSYGYAGYFIRLNETAENFDKRFIVDEAGYDDHDPFYVNTRSVKIVGDWEVELYDSYNFAGRSIRITDSVQNLDLSFPSFNYALSAKLYRKANPNPVISIINLLLDD